MRVRHEFPRIQDLRSDRDGTFLSYLTTRIDRDLGGNVYRFVVDRLDLSVELEVTVDRTAVIGAASEARAAGLDYDQWSYVQRKEYIERYSEEHGQWFVVRLFEVVKGELGDELPLARDLFTKTFFEYASSFRNSQDGYVEGEDGYYPDTIEFIPHGVARNHHVLVRPDAAS